ncbi:MAG: HutD family protein [Sphingomonadales bacterium]|nr:HutD family protein [Sphingomonadales bacterium]
MTQGKMSHPNLLPASARVATPWKNGGGRTWEIAAYPPGSGLDDFGWRISTAEVEAAGPFSTFPQIDRILTVLEGRLELRRDDDGESILLEVGQSHAFPGDVAIVGRPIVGPVRDLNVMVRRGAWTAAVSTSRPPQMPGTTVIAVASQSGGGLDALDAVRLMDGAVLPGDFTGYFISLRCI